MITMGAGNRHERGSDGRLEVDFEMLLHLRWVVGSNSNGTEDWFIVRIHITQDHAIERGFANAYA